MLSQTRGFFNYLFNNKNINGKFLLSEKKQIYEINSWKKELISKIVRSRLFDHLGIIQVLNGNRDDITKNDLIFSFNRFVDSNSPYILYVENPTALYHYSLLRGKSLLGKRKIKKLLESKNLYAVIFMSEACEKTFSEVCGPLPGNIKKKTIYPLIKDNSFFSLASLSKKSKEKKLRLLFIAQGKRFISKGGLELIELMKRLEYFDISLSIVTNSNLLNPEILNRIVTSKNVELIEFNLDNKSLEKLYFNHHILVHPTSDDSFGIVILEAMKAGLPIISTDLYAIKELVQNEVNGFLTKPKFYFFSPDDLPNESVWNNRNQTINNSDILDKKLIDFLELKILFFYRNRDVLEKMSLNSYNISKGNKFSEESIINDWNELIRHE
ncbi:hypothetical protein EsVE80_05280 [Enterococcus saigonensis]|uniref:Glycosyl transferase family 1 domain-containing protein n=1 Tax=Enterococcus saigonensis TaxID=1805431 RepID=A0A679II55_9ENTE|nr:glycosyltransferase family 4 protein [Enterococcus saigonensis]BCA85005.1 hypothetical protein EsVE80_05280 [Enterococcus saigonensis]